MTMPMERHVLGKVDYQETFESMKKITRERDDSAADQLWLLQHDPVFTQGISGKAEHLLSPGIFLSFKLIEAGR